MVRTLLIAAWLVTLPITPAASAAEQTSLDQEHLRSQIMAWQQRLNVPMNPSVSQAWTDASMRWRILQEAAPAEQQEAARQLALALRALEHAWQKQRTENDERPFFYAIDTATRMIT